MIITKIVKVVYTAESDLNDDRFNKTKAQLKSMRDDHIAGISNALKLGAYYSVISHSAKVLILNDVISKLD